MATRDEMAEALQCAWNEHCTDTGDFPDFLTVEATTPTVVLSANFYRGEFARTVASWLIAIDDRGPDEDDEAPRSGRSES